MTGTLSWVKESTMTYNEKDNRLVSYNGAESNFDLDGNMIQGVNPITEGDFAWIYDRICEGY